MEEEVTEILHNCAPLPAHPSHTTARKILHVIEVRDAQDGTRCTAGLPRTELSVLMRGEPILDHVYRYAIINKHLYTTRRNGVVLVVKCTDNEPEPAQAES